MKSLQLLLGALVIIFISSSLPLSPDPDVEICLPGQESLLSHDSLFLPMQREVQPFSQSFEISSLPAEKICNHTCNPSFPSGENNPQERAFHKLSLEIQQLKLEISPREIPQPATTEKSVSHHLIQHEKP